MTEVTLAQIAAVANTQVDRKIRLQLMLWYSIRPTYLEFVELVHEGLSWQSQQLARNPQHRQNLREDQLSTILVDNLKCLGFAAKFDVAVGGHCDITIEYGTDYLWLGEAKKYDGPEWLFQGFQQLTTRYATGHANECYGGIIIYCYQPRVDKLMEKWTARLQQHGIHDSDILKKPDIDANAFSTKSISERTGVTLNTLHLPVSLYFNPQDI